MWFKSNNFGVVYGGFKCYVEVENMLIDIWYVVYGHGPFRIILSNVWKVEYVMLCNQITCWNSVCEMDVYVMRLVMHWSLCED